MLARQQLNTICQGHHGSRGRSAAAGFFDQPSSDIYGFIARVEYLNELITGPDLPARAELANQNVIGWGGCGCRS